MHAQVSGKPLGYVVKLGMLGETRDAMPQFTDHDVERLATMLVGTGRKLPSAAYAVVGQDLSPDELLDVEARLLTQEGLFRCDGCQTWLGTGQLDPHSNELCYGCAGSGIVDR